MFTGAAAQSRCFRGNVIDRPVYFAKQPANVIIDGRLQVTLSGRPISGQPFHRNELFDHIGI